MLVLTGAADEIVCFVRVTERASLANLLKPENKTKIIYLLQVDLCRIVMFGISVISTVARRTYPSVLISVSKTNLTNGLKRNEFAPLE
jgi:hypothetical protein